MTDPRMDPAGSPGSQSGANAPGSGGSGRRRGLFHRGSASGQGQAGNAASGGVSTATRTTPSSSVPQQAGQAGQQQPATSYGRTEYEYAESGYASPGQGQDMLAKAANLSWTVVAIGALGLIALGIMLLVWPNISLTIVAILIGAALVVSGVVHLFEGFTARGGESGGMRAGHIVIGLLAVIAGLYCLRHHALTLYLVAFVTGVYFVLQGIAEIGASASAISGRGLRVVLGIFSIGAGLVLIIWPQISLVLLFTILGAWLLFYGIVLGGLAFSLRRTAKEVKSASASTMAARARTA